MNDSVPKRARKQRRSARPSAEDAYKRTLHGLRVELVKLQKHLISRGERLLVIREGRDASGKDGTIKRIVKHLSPRETRVVALGPPSDRERRSWYFQRYVPHLPAAQELVLFNRSWYNRAGVEHVMGFCSSDEHQLFLETVPQFEHMLVRSGITLIKYYLDISKREQKRRLASRRVSPLKQWKRSSVDDEAVARWGAYTRARNEMLARTHTPISPWRNVRADDKRATRLEIMRDLLTHVDYPKKRNRLLSSDPEAVFVFDATYLANGGLAG
jgi:polyphosphate kinase 2